MPARGWRSLLGRDGKLAFRREIKTPGPESDQKLSYHHAPKYALH
jgi:hypothetical protein